MYLKRFAAYLGKEQENIFSRFFTSENLFLLVGMEGAEAKDQLREDFNLFFNELSTAPINGLESLDQFIYEKIKELNLPAGLSLVCGLKKENILYLKSINGQIFIYHRNRLAKLIDGDGSASGYIKDGDLFIFTTASFINLVKGEEELKKHLKEGNPSKIVGRLVPELEPFDSRGTIALFIQFLISNEDNHFPDKNQEEKLFISKRNFFTGIKRRFADLFQKKFRSSPKFLTTSKNKKMTFVLVFVLLAVLVWSVVLGYSRRERARKLKKITEVSKTIKDKLLSEQEGVLSVSESKKSITEAKKDLADLRREIGPGFEKQLAAIEESIKLREKKIINEENKKAEEFFDLALEDKDAIGKKLYLSKNKLAILATGGRYYLLDLDKKAVDKYAHPQLEAVDFLAFYNNSPFFFSQKKGIFTLQNNQLKKLVDADEAWQDIGDFNVYGGNLYLLDRDQGNIDRYLVIENGYSDKKPYFKTNDEPPLNLRGANSMAIDGAIYIGFTNRVIKYLAGKRQKFSLSLPDENPALTKIYTNRDLNKVYLFSKTHRAIYQLAKDGTYEKEFKSASLEKTSEIVFYHQAAYFIIGSKIFKLSL